ncbi:sensor domain-containing diguanylate cyclase [Lysobacter sp. BMK333-48F3]|uniref:GGDEF domain-containing protein n=1 Tax=Lysobacter sp. BMK333-48F3 TaxID=2867962 RepID=UPI001C8BEA4E|nr:sensor domain-containing diguanylate cyclase [Lysobacter sp. BMK333-48F3]MBX9400192.1 sensor domain-containing diguanylate cyclase [Lysobacter sp. BMK333-48F3]
MPIVPLRPSPFPLLPEPHDEAARQTTLEGYELLDSVPEAAYDDLVRLAATLCDAPAAAIALVDNGRIWYKARHGFGETERVRSQSICSQLIADAEADRLLVIADTAEDPRFAGLGLRLDGRPLRFYAGAPLMSPDGYALGTLCVLDHRPHDLRAAQRDGVAVIARQVQHLFELRRYAIEQRRLLSEREAFARELESAQADLQRRHELLEHSARHDALTGLLNRSALSQLLGSEDAMESLRRAAYTLLLVDVDHFKQVNDRYGHLLGDRALRAVADAIAASIRDGDVAVRFGGEEFLVVLPGTHLATATEVGERIRQRLARASLPFALTVSIGVAGGDPSRERPEQVFDRADRALYLAKAQGRDRLAVDEG